MHVNMSGDLTRPEEGVCAAVSLLHAAITRPVFVFLSLYMVARLEQGKR